MFDQPYPFEKCGRSTTLIAEPFEKVFYRFQATRRKYLVSFESFSSGISAVKFCDIKQKNNPHRFDHVYDDGDAIRVIGTCLHIMRDFWQRKPDASFCFYAVPRSGDELLLRQRFVHLDAASALLAIDRHLSVRYSIYMRAMTDLFSSDNFRHLRDPANYLYVLINKRQADTSGALKSLASYLQHNYDMLFNALESG